LKKVLKIEHALDIIIPARDLQKTTDNDCHFEKEISLLKTFLLNVKEERNISSNELFQV